MKPRWPRVLIQGSAFAGVAGLYVVFWLAGVRVLGSGVLFLSILPVCLLAWMGGLAGAFWAGVIILPVNYLLVVVQGHEFHFTLPAPYFWHGQVIAILIGVLVGYIRDSRISFQKELDRRKEIEMSLRESEYRFRALFHQSQSAVFITNMDGVILHANRSSAEMLGYSIEEMIGMHATELSAPEEVPKTRLRLAELREGKPIPSYERLARRKDGSTFPVEVYVTVVKDEQGKPMYIQSISYDITERKRMEAQLQHMATHDPLTGLANRALFFDRLNQALARAERKGGRVAVMFVDLNGFKQVNDRHGHVKGDQLLVTIAQRLEAYFRETDTIARIGGDEFSLILEEFPSLEQLHALASRAVEVFASPFYLEGEPVYIGASIGISLYPEHGSDAGTLVNRADKAMYVVKQTGKNGFAVYQEGDF